MKLKDKVVVVTGGGSGIGRQLVLQLLRRGAQVCAIDLRTEGLASIVELAEAGDRLSTAAVDITDRDGTMALPAKVTAVHGRIDGVINNAGIIQPFVRLNDLEWEAIERVLDVNLFGTINMVKAFLPHLLARPEAHLVNVSSMGGFLPVPGQTIYGASKAAVKLMTEGLYAELLETSVRVSVVMPGAVSTEIAAHSGLEPPSGEAAEEGGFPTTSAEEAARIILEGIEGDALHIHVGRDARMMSLANRLAPRRSTHMIYRRMKDLLPP